MFTGGSQFAMVGVIGGGGAAMTGAATAIMLGVRNAFYAVRLSGILDVHSWRRPVAAQLMIDESTAMAVLRTTTRSLATRILGHRRVGLRRSGTLPL